MVGNRLLGAGGSASGRIDDGTHKIARNGNIERRFEAKSGALAVKDEMDKIYPNPSFYNKNWYQQKPYGFIFTPRKGSSSTFYLPIAPSNITINTHFATNVISTMYGTVEEHSEQRYYDITIAGTTGMSPRYYDVIEDQVADVDSTNVVGRAPFPVKSLLNTGGFAQRTVSLVSNALEQAADIFGDDNGSTGIDLERTGYMAFHNFYRWLLNYKKDISGEEGNSNRGRRDHPLQFLNFKDNNMYDVAIQGFQLTRSANSPMLYNYNITMRAYNLRNADGIKIQADIKDRAEELGLSDINSSFFSKMASKVGKAKNAASSAIAAIKGFGS